jgi:hypothetical protein
MSGVSSVTALCKVGKQAAKGTGINTGMMCGMLTMSGFNPDFDELDDLQEHGCRTVSVDRATAKKSATDRAGYIVRGRLGGYLYPNLIGRMLHMAGFKPTTTTLATGVYRHVFKLSTRSDYLWFTVLSKIGDRTRRAVDCRASTLNIESSLRGINWTADILGLSTGTAPGSETGTDETLVKMLPGSGELTIMDGATTVFSSATDTVQSMALKIANPLDDADQSLFAFTRAGLEQQGVDITGSLRGLDLDYSSYYDLLVGATPSASVAVLDIDWKWQSSVEFVATYPYSLRVEIPAAEMTLDDFEASGNNIVRWDTQFRMLDNQTDPVLITLVNAVSSY